MVEQNNGNSGTGVPMIFPMVDERNKRGRPPKKPKTAEMEQKEKNLIH